MSDDTPSLPGLSPVCGLDIHARFDGGAMTSNGGALLLREAGRGLDLTKVLAGCIRDARDPAKVIHSYASMIDARIGVIACGHEDCDDLDVLRHDPALKMFCEKSPEAYVGLASQPTLSRLENAVGWRVLARMGLRIIHTYCDSFARPPRQIVLDIDDTTDLVHGGQQLSLFNTPGGGYCFQPILIFEAATGKPVAAILRAGKRPSGEEAARVLCHAVRRIRSNWPLIAITVRGDARVEATTLGSDTRFIVTNIASGRAKYLYAKVYCARGRMENMIKEHKLYLKSDRTSCHRWEANQFRLILHTAAYWLMLRVRGAAPKKSQWRRATFESIRNTFLKIAARVAQIKTRIRVSFPTATPNIGVINTMLGKLAAQAP